MLGDRGVGSVLFFGSLNPVCVYILDTCKGQKSTVIHQQKESKLIQDSKDFTVCFLKYSRKFFQLPEELSDEAGEKYFRETVASGLSEQLNKNITELKQSCCG